ncbi:hypothetical protein [Kribbella speibonae]|uniref:Uncharacterized protein n=1 Tax=Kribbella speibonae TaxID=1572660 RepID=A0A4R0IXQ9_9ACTN|nr:hypothetical protein [Kribbella speibonae]TCC36358.1 hypothetical protein E0H92_27305 [Kribbella speibonae]
MVQRVLGLVDHDQPGRPDPDPHPRTPYSARRTPEAVLAEIDTTRSAVADAPIRHPSPRDE